MYFIKRKTQVSILIVAMVFSFLTVTGVLQEVYAAEYPAAFLDSGSLEMEKLSKEEIIDLLADAPTDMSDEPEDMNDAFDDVHNKDYFYDAVTWAVNHDPQITKGTSNTTFSPSDTCTRGQAVTFLWRACGCEKVTDVENPFTDVKSTDYYYDAVLWAYKNNITTGTTTTTFGPNETCNRGQIVTFLWRSLNQPASNASISFNDVADDAYYYTPVRWAVENGVTKGTSDTKFSPGDSCTRGQIVTFLYRAKDLNGNSSGNGNGDILLPEI